MWKQLPSTEYLSKKNGKEGVECSVLANKVNVVCPKCSKPTRIGYSEEKGEKVRVCKKCGAKIK